MENLSLLPGASELASPEAKAALKSLKEAMNIIETRGTVEDEDTLKRLLNDAQVFVDAAADLRQFDTGFISQNLAQAKMREKMAEALKSTAEITVPEEKILAQAAAATYFQYLVTNNPYWKQTYYQPGGWKKLRDSILGKIPSEKKQDYIDSRLHTMTPEDFKHIAWTGLANSLIKTHGQEEYDKWKEFIFTIT